MTRSASRIDTAIEQRGSRATLRPLRVRVPVWNQKVPSSQTAPTAVTCGLPSSLTVVSHVVRALCASGAGADPASSFSVTAAQFTGGSPSAAPTARRQQTNQSQPFTGPGHRWEPVDDDSGRRLCVGWRVHYDEPGRFVEAQSEPHSVTVQFGLFDSTYPSGAADRGYAKSLTYSADEHGQWSLETNEQ